MAYTNKFAGRGLRELRNNLGLTMHDVCELTRETAKLYCNPYYVVSLTRLSDIERAGAIPNLYRLHSLAVAYGREMSELLTFYGIS